jgi:S1-C subfamily serine protease
MGKRFSRVGAFVAGAVSIVVIVVLLMAFGVVPVKTETTTLVRSSGTTTTAASTTSSTDGGLTAEQIYQKYASGVVEVLATFSQQGFSPYGQQSSGQALGSGFVVSKDGQILTNAHVIADNGMQAGSVEVVFKGQGQDGGTHVEATVVGVDETSDVALLKVDPTKAPALNPLPLGDSSKVVVGEPVVAIGNPLGYDFSVTSGIVSATNRQLQSPNGSVISDGIQTDAAINSGNSGGPLIDASGNVIGVNEQIASQSGGNQGLGFAVPINTAVSVMKQLQQSGKVTYAYLGIEGQTVSSDVAAALGLKTDSGVLIASVASGSPAAVAGLKGGSQQQTLQGQTYVVGGDIITAFDGVAVTSIEGLIADINQHKPGDKVTITVVSDGSTRDVEVTLSERPSTTG